MARFHQSMSDLVCCIFSLRISIEFQFVARDETSSQPQEASQSNNPMYSTYHTEASSAADDPIESEALGRAIHLILAARERVLTLSEQRVRHIFSILVTGFH
jgi:hypothetical protein